ncbi:hypothetical protein JCM11491_000349 [Sporobolomyces phaffii]
MYISNPADESHADHRCSLLGSRHQMGQSSSAVKITPQDRSILDLKLQRDKLKQYQKRIEVVLNREREIAAESLRAGNKNRALIALRQKKYQETLLSQTDSQLETLQKLVQGIEFSLVEKDVLFGLQQGNDVLKQLNKELDINKVEKLMDETREGIAYQEEVSALLSSRISAQDEEEVLAELAALQEAELGDKLPQVPVNRLPTPEQTTESRVATPTSSARRRRGDGDDSDRRREEDRQFERERERERDRERGDRRRRDYDDDDDYHRSRAAPPKRSRRDDRDRSRSRDRGDNRRPYYDNAPPPRRDDRRSRRGEDEYDDRRSRHRRSPSYDEYNRRGSPRRGARSPSPGLSEEQREMRSVFVNQIAARVTDRELGIFFEANAGKVRDARVIVDRISRRSKGVGYVEFVDLESVQKALTLSGTKLLGIPLIVQYTEAEKNRQARDNTGGSGGVGGPMNGGLYVGSLNFALTAEDIREVFQPFGELETVELHRDPMTGKSKGYSFVKFKEHKDAMVAIEKMNNFPLAGREIKVGLVADRSTTFNKHLTTAPEPNLQLEEQGGNPGGISRYELMQKLAGVDKGPELPPQPMFRPNIPQNTTRNVLMKDAFNPEEETERDWDLELADDVKGECEAKYGKVLDIFVVKESKGEIYIRFEKVEDAVKATQGLNGRWFGGRQISASHVGDSLYDANVVKK